MIKKNEIRSIKFQSQLLGSQIPKFKEKHPPYMIGSMAGYYEEFYDQELTKYFNHPYLKLCKLQVRYVLKSLSNLFIIYKFGENSNTIIGLVSDWLKSILILTGDRYLVILSEGF